MSKTTKTTLVKEKIEEEAKVTVEIESHYAKQPDGFVYRYWRVVGSDTWNLQKTAMKDVPIIELTATESPLKPVKEEL